MIAKVKVALLRCGSRAVARRDAHNNDEDCDVDRDETGP